MTHTNCSKTKTKKIDQILLRTRLRETTRKFTFTVNGDQEPGTIINEANVTFRWLLTLICISSSFSMSAFANFTCSSRRRSYSWTKSVNNSLFSVLMLFFSNFALVNSSERAADLVSYGFIGFIFAHSRPVKRDENERKEKNTQKMKHLNFSFSMHRKWTGNPSAARLLALAMKTWILGTQRKALKPYLA